MSTTKSSKAETFTVPLANVSDKDKHALEAWKDNCLRNGEALIFFVAIDIGGTNTRFLVRFGEESDQNEFVMKFPSCGSTRHLLRQFNHISEQIFDILGEQGCGAALSLAGPIRQGGSSVSLTNFKAPEGSSDRSMLIRELPIKAFPHNRSYFLNDLESASYGIIALHQNHELGSYFSLMWDVEGFNSETPVYLKHTNNLVIAMGTGLGVGLVVAKRHVHGTRRADMKFAALAMEAGHHPSTPLGPASSRYEEDQAFRKFLSEKLYDGLYPIEWEDTCSGRGLEYCYEWVVRDVKDVKDKKSEGEGENDEVAKTRTAKEISESARRENPCPYSRAAMLLSYRFLMRAIQATAISTQAKGIFLCGDNQVLDDPFLMSAVNELREEFISHPRSDFFELDRIPIYRQVEKKNINLEGCMYVARNGTL